MNTAIKGRSGEHEVRDLLKAQGYYVIRAAGSKGMVDLVAIPTFERRLYQVENINLIQVKRGTNITNREKKLFRELPVEAVKEIWFRKDRSQWQVETI